MPMLTVEWLEGRTHRQKAQLAQALTQAFVEITRVPQEQVWIVFHDVKRADWAMSGQLLRVRPSISRGRAGPSGEARKARGV